MKKYVTPELNITKYVLSKEIALNVGSNVWTDDEELDENGDPIEN